MRENEKFDKDDRKADALMCRCINCQSVHEESVKETEKDNEQIWKRVHEKEKTCWQLSEKSEREVNNIIWKSSCVQHQYIIINAKLLQEIWSKDLHQRERKSKENHDDNNKEHSEISKKDWHRQDAVNMQEYKDNEEMIETADISSQDEEQQENIEEKWFLNQKDIVEHMSVQNQFWSNNT